MAMVRRFTILIADRNRRVRQFLGREFVSAGYRVLVAGNGNELSGMIRQNDGLDLLILDEEILALNECGVLEQLENLIPPLPFIIHSFSPECLDSTLVGTAAALVKKEGDIEELKCAVRDVLSRPYPHRVNRVAERPA
jgi:DNA-binding response OmpR family regulator